jgi:hypothetical protein
MENYYYHPNVSYSDIKASISMVSKSGLEGICSPVIASAGDDLAGAGLFLAFPLLVGAGILALGKLCGYKKPKSINPDNDINMGS